VTLQALDAGPLPISILAPRRPPASMPLPFFESTVPAGVPSPAGDYLDQELDLNELVIRHPAATFFVRVEGESMIGAGIHPGDTLVVDRAEEPADNKIVVAMIDGRFAVKRLRRRGSRLYLASENAALPPLPITEGMTFEVWGVVTYVVHRVQ
jgi:DNA polymerase V